MHLIYLGESRMSDSSSGKEEENESLSDGWTFVDDDESARNGQSNEDNGEDHEGGVTPPPEEEEEVEVEVEVTEEEEEEDDLSKGQQVQEVKVISGTESSDIETIDYPRVEELRELYVSQIPSNQGMRDSFNSFFSRGTPNSDYTVDADTESLSSEGSPEEKVRRRRTRKPEAIQDEETDLSLASSPSLPDDLPAIKPDPQYVHTPRPEINYRLNLIVGLTIVLVAGLGLGHFLGWSRRSLWDENLNAAQVRKLRELQDSLLSCMSASSPTTDGASHIPSLRCSASERIDIDVDPTFKSNIIQPHKYDPSSGSSMVETFVEPLEDTGIIFNAIPFHEHQYEPLSHTDVDNTEELLLPDYDGDPSLQLDDPSFSSPGISENNSTNIIEDTNLIDDKHVDHLSVNFPQIKTHHVDEIQITGNIDINNPVIEFEIDSNSPIIENDDLSNDKRYDANNNPIIDANNNPIIEIPKLDVNKQDEGFTTIKNLKVTNEFLSDHLGNMNPIIDMFLNYDQDKELTPNKNLNTGNDLLNDHLGNLNPIIEMILNSDKQKEMPSSVDDIRKGLQQYFTSLMERDNDNLPIHSINSEDIDLSISENEPYINVNHENSFYNEQNIIEEPIDDEEYESSLPHIQNNWVPNNEKSESEMDSLLEEEHSNEKQEAILEENEKDPFVLKHEKLEINHVETSNYDQIEVNNEFIEPVVGKEKYPSRKLKTLEKHKNEAFIDVDVLNSENKIYTCKNARIPNCVEIENIDLDKRHLLESSLDNDNLEEYINTLLEENNLKLMKGSILYSTLLNSFHRLFDKNLFEKNLIKDPYIVFLEGFKEILIANFPEEFRKRKVLREKNELKKPTLDYKIKKEICKFLQANIKLQKIFPYDLQFHCDDHLNIIETNMQILENLNLENEELQDRVSELQAEHTEPFKIKGKDGKEARSLRERINHLIAENEDMRLALSRYQYSGLPDADKGEFNKVSQENQHLRKTVLQLTHLVPDNGKLEVSLQYFKDQHQDLLRKVGKIRHEQPLPKELTPMIKQLEEMRSVVAQEAKKKNPPSSIANARSYLTYMGQVFSQFTYLHDWEEKSAAEKIDLAKDIFAYWLPKGVKLSPKMQDDIVKTKSHFSTIKSSIRKKWKQLKDFTNPDTIVTVGQSTVAKMNRVIVNVVNKMKDIGQTTIMSTNKQLEHSIYALSQGLAKLNKQFDETWKSLEIRIAMSEKYDLDANEDDDENNDNEDDDDDDNNDDEEDVIGNYIKSSTNDEEEFVNENVDFKHKSQAPDTDIKPDVEEKPTLDSHKIKEEVQKQIVDKEIEKIKGKDDHKREPYHDKRKEYGKNRKVDLKEKKKSPPEKFAKPYEKEVPKSKGGEWHKEEKKDTFVKEDKKEEKKSLADRIKEKREEKQTKEDSRYFKGQYNKFDKVKEDSGKPASDYSRKQQKRKDNNDDDDEDEVGDTKKATGLKRHWEKPQKKNFFREQSGPKKQFIRRRGKNDEGPGRDENDVREKKQDKKRLETKEGKEWNKKDDKRNKDNRDDKQNKDNKNDRRNIDTKDDRRNKYNKDDRRNKDNKDERQNKNNKDDRRNKDNKEHKNKSKDKWNYKNNDLNSKYLKREGKHGNKVGFDFKKGMYRNREKYVPKSHEIKFLKTSPDLVVPPRYNVQQLRHKDN